MLKFFGLAGLILALCGVLIILRYGLPYRKMTGKVDLMDHQTVDEILVSVEKVKLRKRSNWGVYLIVAGLLLQIASHLG